MRPLVTMPASVIIVDLPYRAKTTPRCCEESYSRRELHWLHLEASNMLGLCRRVAISTGGVMV